MCIDNCKHNSSISLHNMHNHFIAHTSHNLHIFHVLDFVTSSCFDMYKMRIFDKNITTAFQSSSHTERVDSQKHIFLGAGRSGIQKWFVTPPPTWWIWLVLRYTQTRPQHSSIYFIFISPEHNSSYPLVICELLPRVICQLLIELSASYPCP